MINAIICDLDGTLFDCKWRREKFLPNFNEFNKNHIHDKIKQPILEILKSMKDKYEIIFISGRNEDFRKITEEQLSKYIDKYILFMRQNNDFRGDEIIKKEIYIEKIKDKYNILFVLDDRQKVVNMWRDLNLTCLQVTNGDF